MENIPPKGKSMTEINREELKDKLKKVLDTEFPDETVYVSDGYADNIHILIVSTNFDGMSDIVRKEYIQTIIKKEVNEEEQKLTSVIYAISPREIL